MSKSVGTLEQSEFLRKVGVALISLGALHTVAVLAG
jgi:hypothetical protein